MREILFRGKRDDNGEWAYGYLVRHPSAIQIGDSSNPWYIHVPPADPDDNGGVYNTDPATVGQYTGLKDKNGVRIFEGDIIVAPSFNRTISKYMVEHDTALASFIGKRPVGEQFTTFDGDAEVFEIVGNIHDNPELMERENRWTEEGAEDGEDDI